MFKRRLYEVDILRGMTFLAIVMQHTLANFLYSPELSTVAALVAGVILVFIRYAVPMFIFITGLVLFYNHSEGEFRYGEFLHKRFTQIFIPYVAWTVIYYFWSGTGGAKTAVILADLGRLTLSGEACYHLWFMVAIIQFYLLFPMFRWFVLKYKKSPIPVLFLALLAYIALMWFNTYSAPYLYEQTQNSVIKVLLAYRDRLFVSWFFYFILGGYAGLNARKLRIILSYALRGNIFVYLISFLAVLGAVISTGKTGPSGAYQFNFLFTLPLTPLMVIFLVSSLLTMYYGALTYFRKDLIWTRIMKTFGRYSYGCYFAHAMVLYYANLFIHNFWPNLEPLPYLVLAFTATSLFSLLACYLISLFRIPIGNMLVGRIPSS